MELEKSDILFFVGMKHSGKTTFASRVASNFGWEFADLDELILPYLNGLTIREFYKKNGKESFMEKERDVLKKFISTLSVKTVISLGGGVSDNLDLIKELSDNGIIIYLKRDEEDLLPVILKDGIPPFLDPSNLESSFHTLYKKRDSIYRDIADVTIDLGPFRDKDDTEEFLLDVLKEHGYGL